MSQMTLPSPCLLKASRTYLVLIVFFVLTEEFEEYEIFEETKIIFNLRYLDLVSLITSRRSIPVSFFLE